MNFEKREHPSGVIGPHGFPTLKVAPKPDEVVPRTKANAGISWKVYKRTRDGRDLAGYLFPNTRSKPA